MSDDKNKKSKLEAEAVSCIKSKKVRVPRHTIKATIEDVIDFGDMTQKERLMSAMFGPSHAEISLDFQSFMRTDDEGRLLIDPKQFEGTIGDNPEALVCNDALTALVVHQLCSTSDTKQDFLHGLSTMLCIILARSCRFVGCGLPDVNNLSSVMDYVVDHFVRGKNTCNCPVCRSTAVYAEEKQESAREMDKQVLKERADDVANIPDDVLVALTRNQGIN